MSVGVRKAESGERGVAIPTWLRLARVFQKISTHSDHLFREHGLNTAQFDVLTHIGTAQGKSQQALADALLVTKGNISQLLGKLEQRGMITRRHEGRANCLSLTDSGREMFDLVVPEQESMVARLFSALSDCEQRVLLRMLRKLDRSLAM